MLKMSRLSVEHFRVPVAEIIAGQPADVSALPLRVAIMRGSANPASGDWVTGGWETDTSTSPARYWALVAANGPNLGPGTFTIWLEITGSGDVVKRDVGQLKIE
jgi:hypothetical protein